jgi:hypothetical protein
MSIGFETAGLPVREVSSFEATTCGRPFLRQDKLHLSNVASKPLLGFQCNGQSYSDIFEKARIAIGIAGPSIAMTKMTLVGHIEI